MSGFLFAIVLAGVASPPVAASHTTIDCAHARSTIANLQPAPVAGSEFEELTDVEHYHLDLTIDPANDWIGGSNTLTVRSLVAGLSKFEIRLDDDLDIHSITVNGAPASWAYTTVPNIEITLQPPMLLGEVFEVRVDYSGFPVALFFGSIVFVHEWPSPLVYTLSEPWLAYTWWPVKESNVDKATGDLWFTVPNPFQVASNGLRQGIDPIQPGWHRVRWATNYPTAPYLFAFAAAPYTVFTSQYVHADGVMPLEFMVLPEHDSPWLRANWLETREMLSVLGELFGPYPFLNEKYGIYEFAFSGGMEHQTMSGQWAIPSTWLTVHELAHQWWGDLVTCATWQDLWLNEGFASYSEALYAEFRVNPPSEEELLDAMEAPSPEVLAESVYRYEGSSLFTSVVYDKGAWVLHMLRHILGDALFFDSLREYRERFAYGSATTDDLIRAFEDVVGEPLDWFFVPWVYDIGAPDYRWAWQPVQAHGQHFVELYVAQVQPPDFALFTMPIDLRIFPGQSLWRTIWNDAPAEHQLVGVPSAAQGVQFDPKNYIAKFGVTQISFPAGPPKIVHLEPAADAVVMQNGNPLRVGFHRPVQPNPDAFLLLGMTTGPIALDVAYDAGGQLATLQPQTPLTPQEYTLIVLDSVMSSSNQIRLDGELEAPFKPPGLPSGDGLPGGSAMIPFTIVPAGDLNGDGAVGLPDLGILLQAFGVSAAGDCDGDGDTDLADLGVLLQAYQG